jgi:hypothetical protein
MIPAQGVVITPTGKAHERIELFHRLTIRGRRWFWRVRAANSRIVAIGGEGYVNYMDALEIADKVTGHRLPHYSV